MAIDPRTTEEILLSLQQTLAGRIDKLTNFVEGSFNRVAIAGFASEFHEVESRLLAAQLSGWVDYAGNSELDLTDFGQLGVDGATPDEVNPFMEDSHLDELGKVVGVTRDPGEPAVGYVTIQTATDDTRVYEGLEVATQPDADGEYFSYFVDIDEDGEIDPGSEFVTPDAGETSVQVAVIAEDVGDDYNVGPGSVTYLPSPDPGIEGVLNNQTITGGVGRQSNDELRLNIKNAVFQTSGGGTAAGIEGFIENEVSGVNDVGLDEFYSVQPPFVDVIVDGGTDTEVLGAINASRPTGIRHNLVRPEIISTGIRTDLVGTGIDTSYTQDIITQYLTDLSLNDEFRRSKLVQHILNADDDIQDVGSLSVMILNVAGERKTYQTGTDQYELDFSPLGKVDDEEFLFDDTQDVYTLLYEDVDETTTNLTAQVNGSEVTLVEGTDYEVIDDSGDGLNDAVDFSIGGQTPDNRSVVLVEYEHASWSVASTIEDESGDTYDKGVDWDAVDTNADGLIDSIDWSIGGSTPDDGEGWTITYEPKTTAARDVAVSQREKITAGNRIETRTFDPVIL
jgi:hypothetical protein